MTTEPDHANWTVRYVSNPAEGLTKHILSGLVSGEELILAAGDDFQGRTSTRLIRNNGYILKLRLEETASEALLQQSVKAEQKLGVFHPEKVWFVVNDGSQSYLGNICPEVIPLNQLLLSPQPDNTDQFVDMVNEILRLSLMVLSRFNQYLDISLSNFGYDKSGDVIYYIDDDLYSAGENDFGALSESIAIILRNYTETPLDAWNEIGQRLRELFDEYFGPSKLGKLSYAIGDPPLVRPEAVDRRNTMLKGMLRKPIPRDQVVPAAKVPDHVGLVVGPKPDGPPVIALLSDIHANVAALDAVIEELTRHNVQKIIITGDVVGYGPDPGACIDRLQQLGNIYIVQGNHDHGAAQMGPEEIIDNFNGVPRDVLLWTQNVLSDNQKQWLENLPREIRTEDYWVMHGSPKDPRKMYGYVYVMTYQDNLDVIEQQDVTRCFYGHTHVPGVYRRRGKQDEHIVQNSVTLKETDYALINPGSVGQPRGGKPGAEFALLSEDMNKIDFYRLAYPTEDLFRRMRESSLPEGLEERILNGR